MLIKFVKGELLRNLQYHFSKVSMQIFLTCLIGLLVATMFLPRICDRCGGKGHRSQMSSFLPAGNLSLCGTDVTLLYRRNSK